VQPAGAQTPSPGRWTSSCQTVAALINLAYVRFANGRSNGAPFVPLSGGPPWIRAERYVVSAKAGEAASQETMQGPMLQALLEDRFKLKIHRETREVPVYFVTVAKGGLKLPPFKEGGCAPPDPNQPRSPGQLPACGALGIRVNGLNLTLAPRGITIEEFVSDFLPTILDRPVIDKTGVAGKFDFSLQFSADESTPGVRINSAGVGPNDPPPAPSIFTAIQEQLGLKLESGKGPGEFLIIDSVERPSEN
jgi:uncharacterized protein (TIGR03435 family)